MMSPGDSGLQQRIINAFINYFLNTETTAIAVETTLTRLSAMEQEYTKHDNSSWLGMVTSKVTVPIPFILIGKDSHLEKIKICRESLDNAKKQNVENLGKSAVGILLDFFKKSEDWHVAGLVRGPSINMRLACELLQAAGIKEDCSAFLSEYPGDFIKELEAASVKISASRELVSPTRTLESASTPSAQHRLTSVSMTPLKDSLFQGSRKSLLIVVEGDQQRPPPSSSPTNLLCSLD